MLEETDSLLGALIYKSPLNPVDCLCVSWERWTPEQNRLFIPKLYFGSVPVSQWSSGPSELGTRQRFVHSCAMSCREPQTAVLMETRISERAWFCPDWVSYKQHSYRMLNFASSNQDKTAWADSHTLNHPAVQVFENKTSETEFQRRINLGYEGWASRLFLILQQIEMLRKKNSIKVCRTESNIMRYTRNDHCSQYL